VARIQTEKGSHRPSVPKCVKYTRMPFGLTNEPPTFNKIMQVCLCFKELSTVHISDIFNDDIMYYL